MPTRTRTAFPSDAPFLARVARHLERPAGEWTFALACSLWRWRAGVCGVAVDRQCLRPFVRRLRRLLYTPGEDAALIARALQLHDALLVRYAKHLELLRRRGNDREQ